MKIRRGRGGTAEFGAVTRVEAPAKHDFDGRRSRGIAGMSSTAVAGKGVSQRRRQTQSRAIDQVNAVEPAQQRNADPLGGKFGHLREPSAEQAMHELRRRRSVQTLTQSRVRYVEFPRKLR